MPCVEAMMPWELQGELQRVVLTEDIEEVKKILPHLHEELLDCLDSERRTPLFNACIIGSAEIAKLLMEHAVDVVDINAADIDGETALTMAAARGHLEVVRLLCVAGVDPTICGINGLTPHSRAVAAGHHEVARGLLVYELKWRLSYLEKAEIQKRTTNIKNEAAKRILIRKHFGKNLQIALQIQKERELRELMPADDESTLETESEDSPKAHKLRAHKPTLQPLPASPDGEDEGSVISPMFDILGEFRHPEPEASPPRVFVEKEHPQELEERLQQELQARLTRECEESERKECTALPQQSDLPIRSQSAFSHMSLSQITQSQASPARHRPDSSGPDSLQRLCVAAHTGDLATCVGLARTTHIDPVLRKGHTPLVWAVVGGHVSVVEWLLRRGADPRRPDGCGYTAMFHAVQHSKDDIIVLLARHCRDLLQGVDNEGHNLVQWAAFSGSTRTLRLLTETFDVSIELPDHEGKTALHWAAQEGHVEALQYLLPRCSLLLPFHKDSHGITAEDQARTMNHLKAAQVVRTHCLSLSMPMRNM